MVEDGQSNPPPLPLSPHKSMLDKNSLNNRVKVHKCINTSFSNFKNIKTNHAAFTDTDIVREVNAL